MLCPRNVGRTGRIGVSELGVLVHYSEVAPLPTLQSHQIHKLPELAAFVVLSMIRSETTYIQCIAPIELAKWFVLVLALHFILM